MDKIQKDINDALDPTRRLNLVKIIFVAPFFSLMIMLGTSLPINLFRMASEAGHELVTQLTSVEKGLIPPDSFFGFLFLFCWCYFICCYIITKRNRIKAYLMTQIFQLFLLVISSLNIKKFLNVILFLWLLMSGINLFTNGLNNLLAHLLLALLPISPILLGLFLVSFFKSNLVTLENLNTVNKNQEKYREEYGYTIEEWYGKKSKIYKEHVKKSN